MLIKYKGQTYQRVDSTEGLSAHVKKDLLRRLDKAKTEIEAVKFHVLGNIKSYINELERCEQDIEKAPIDESTGFLEAYKKPLASRAARVCERIEHKAKELKEYF